MLRTVQVKPLEEGDAIFQRHQKQFHEELSAKIPRDLWLPNHLIDNPPKNVLGVPAECGLLSQVELDITSNYDVVALSEAIAKRELTSVAVITAFAKRAAIAHQLTSCLTDWFLDEALVRAKELDEHLHKTGKTVGPLHGIPISIKEMVPIKDHVTSIGMIATRHISPEDCFYTDTLRKLGAVYYVKTNEPTAVMSSECTSWMGRVLNPYNINLSSGGSSGGEAALIAMRGSVFGLGTDIVGSIRTPAAWCGLYGFKPGTGFISNGNLIEGPFPGNLNCDGVLGPLATTLRDLDYVFRAVDTLPQYLRDPDVLPIPYTGMHTLKSSHQLKKLRIGIIKTDNDAHPMPPITRALQWAEEQLLAAGFEITPFVPFPIKEADDLVASFLNTDAGTALHAALAAGHEPYWPMLEVVALEWMNGVTGSKIMSANDVAEGRFKRDQARFKILAEWQAQGNPDIVIGPAHMSPAPLHDSPNWFNYVQQWNLSDSPALVIPTQFKTQAGEEFIPEHREPISDADRRAKELWFRGGNDGSPVSLLIGARRHHENLLMAAAGMIQKALQLP